MRSGAAGQRDLHLQDELQAGGSGRGGGVRAPPHDDPPAPRAPDAGELRYVIDLEYADQPAPAEPIWTAG
jgi:hypothetical protein